MEKDLSKNSFAQRAFEQRRKNRPNPLEYVGAELFVRLVLPRVKRINSNISVNFPDGFAEQLGESVENNDLIVMVSNHDSYHNAQSQAVVSREIFPQIKNGGHFEGFKMPVASSLVTGDQGYIARRIYENSEPMLNENHLYTFPHTRKKDIAEHNTPSNSSEYFRTLNTAIDQNFGIAIFPEGNMGNGSGMREFRDGTLPIIMELAARREKTTTVIPLGIVGSEKILPPHRLPPFSGILAGFWLKDPRLISVNVGSPIRNLELKKTTRKQFNTEEFNNLLGRKVAELIPEKFRGFYK